MGEDLSAALRAWQVEMEVATDSLLRDLGAATQVGTTLPSQSAAVGTALQQFRVTVQLKMILPLTQLEEARERMEGYIRSHLREMLSQHETKSLIRELSSQITDHRGKMCQLLCSEPLRHPEVAPLILVGLANRDQLLPWALRGFAVESGYSRRQREQSSLIIPRGCRACLVYGRGRGHLPD